jgi:hypothetical protein
MEYSDFLYVYYTGPNAWGPGLSENQADQLFSEFEHRIGERFPGLMIFHTLDRPLTGVVGHPYLTAQSAALEKQIQLEIEQIALRVFSGEPEPEL